MTAHSQSLELGFIPIAPLAKDYPTDPSIFFTQSCPIPGRVHPRTMGSSPHNAEIHRRARLFQKVLVTRKEPAIQRATGFGK